MILTGFQSGHGAQSLSPHTALEPPTHMGAIICKVAAVAPGNDLKVLGMHVCACARACRPVCATLVERVYSLLSQPTISSEGGGTRAACRRGDTGRLLCCFKSETLPPTLPSLKKDYLFKYCEALELKCSHAHVRTQAGKQAGRQRCCAVKRYHVQQ